MPCFFFNLCYFHNVGFPLWYAPAVPPELGDTAQIFFFFFGGGGQAKKICPQLQNHVGAYACLWPLGVQKFARYIVWTDWLIADVTSCSCGSVTDAESMPALLYIQFLNQCVASDKRCRNYTVPSLEVRCFGYWKSLCLSCRHSSAEPQ